MLPPLNVDQPCMYVSALEGGNVRTPCDVVTKSWVIFDLGIRRDLEGYTPLCQELIKAKVAESLVKGGVSPDEVETVIISHLHWDHTGDHEPFTRATFVVGEGSRELLASGYPMNKNSLFSVTALPHERTKFLSLSEFSLPIGLFPLAIYFFRDGSMCVINAPGHAEGHINILARTSSDGAWILLGGDSAHDYRFITGEKWVAHNIDSSGCIRCIHGDKEKAAENLTRIRLLLGIPRV
ncbi:beta-lactamase-like protein [Suillus cothurnatus]|nr:beta-lactamase-like protein [Suillus cothurnatus]